MREIRFRGKRIDMDRWVYGQYVITPLTDENSGTTPDAGWFFLTGETRHCIVQDHVAFVIDLKTLGQYTGLKDKNGLNEIYEGDRLKQGKSIGTVVYEEDSFNIIWDEPNYGCWNDILKYHAKICEIIGNIYETAATL